MPGPVVAAATAPWWAPPLIAGAGSIIGGIATSALGAMQAQKNRDFQERMSNTAHQREVIDLQRAGLNPILSSKLGGASSPPGATGQIADFGQATNSALAAMTAGSNLRLQAAQTRDINAAADLKEVQSRVSKRTELEQVDTVRESLYKLRNEADLTWDQRQRLEREIKNLEQTLKILKLDESHSAFDLARARSESDFYQSFGGKVAPWLDHIMRKINLPNISKRVIINPGRR